MKTAGGISAGGGKPAPNALRARLDAAPMSRAQIVAVGLAFLLSALDGYDVLSVAFAAPAITASWGIGKAALGVVLSAGLAGMALGSFFLAPLADTHGRKPMLLVSLVLMAVGMAACGLSQGIGMLSFWRVVTGLGIGACVSIINPIAAEFANARRRALTVSIMAIGYPVGGVVGGLLAAWLLPNFGWEAIFFAGSAGALVMLPLVVWLLPESLAFLLTRGGAENLPRVNAVLARFGQPPVDALPEARPVERRGYAAVFAPAQRGATIWLTSANMLFVMATYYVLSWLPQMVADAGFSAADASRISAISSLSGVVGGVLLGLAGNHGGLRWLVSGAVAGLGLSALAFGLVPDSLPLLTLTGAICGFFLFGAAAGLYATLATTYADEARASGTGFVVGVGRVSSAVAPLLAGWLFSVGLSRGEVSAAFGALAVAAALVLLLGWRRYRPQ